MFLSLPSFSHPFWSPPSNTHSRTHMYTFMPPCLYFHSLSCFPFFLSPCVCLSLLSLTSLYPPLSLCPSSSLLCSRQAFLTFCFAVTFHLCAWLILLNKLQSKQICPSSPLPLSLSLPSLFSPSSLRRLLWFTEETLQSKYSLGISCINMPDFLSPGGGKKMKKLCVTQWFNT